MKMITFIRALKASGRIVAYNLEHNTLPVTYHLRNVRQVTTRYLIDDDGRPYSEFIYAPYPVVINPSIRETEEIPAVPEPLTERKELAPVDVTNDETQKIPVIVEVERVELSTGVPCDLWLPGRDRFTQGQPYLKIADVFSGDGTKYHVLTHKYLGGKLYRKHTQVRLLDNTKAKAA